MTSSVPGRAPRIGRWRTGTEIARDFVLAERRRMALSCVRHLRRGARSGPFGGAGWDRGVSGRWVGGTARRPLIGQPPEAARLRATRAMPLAHWLTCLAGRYAVPFLVWSTMGEARKASRPWGSMKYTAEVWRMSASGLGACTAML